MPIDARIPLAVRPVGPIQQPDLGRIALQAGAIKGQRQNQQLRDLQIQQAQAEAAQRPEMMELDMRGKRAQTANAETQLDYNKLRLLEQQNEQVLNVAASVLQADSQEAYDRGKAYLAQNGIPGIEKLPAVYDKALVKQIYDMNLGAKAKLAQYYKELELAQKQEQEQYKREQDTRTYEQKERHFKESQATTRRGQDIRSQRDTQPTERQAIDKITQLQNMRARLLKGEDLDPAMAFLMARDPKGAAALREAMQANDPQSQNQVLQAIDAAIQYYSPFATGQYRQQSGLEQPAQTPMVGDVPITGFRRIR